MRLPTRPTAAHIHLPTLRSNLRLIQRRVGRGVRVMAVVKANAYGHGIIPVSRYLVSIGVTDLGVAFAEEGLALRADGIRTPVHVFALSYGPQADLCVEHRLDATVATPEGIRHLQRAAVRRRRSVAVHLKVETGMNRIGVRQTDLSSMLRELGRADRLELKGVYTHFATSDVPGSPYVTRQLHRFENAVEQILREGAEPELIHAANSGAILHQPSAMYSMVRAGILMYGYSPSGPGDHTMAVRPALSLSTRVAMVKRIGRGETVSYGRRYRASTPTTIATIPIGYADGLFRSLTGRDAAVMIGGRKLPIVGTICMDQCMVDCGRTPVGVGDEAILIGGSASTRLTAWDLARLAGTIPYEITCAISSRVPRIYHP
jgi:alanine racemase